MYEPSVFTNVVAHDKRKRTKHWEGIIIHHTAVPFTGPQPDSVWARISRAITNYLGRKDSVYVSAHYTIGRDGTVWELADPDKWVTYHAGKSAYYSPLERRWAGSWNDRAIGIELIGDGAKYAYSEAQYLSLAFICKSLLSKYEYIDPRCITGHENIAPGRKVDPGKKFDWRLFFKMLYS